MVDLLEMHLFRELIVSCAVQAHISLAWETLSTIPTDSRDASYQIG